MLLLLLALTPAARAEGIGALPALDGAGVTAVAADGTVTLADGRRVRLAAVRLAEGAHAILEPLVAGRPVVPRGPAEPDRHGRIVAHLVRDDGLWVQAELLRLGAALLMPEPEDAPVLDALRAAEREAELAGRGLWGGSDPPLRAAAAADGTAGSWRIVRGKVRKAARVGDRIYLNFGGDYRRDFTVEIDGRDRKAFAVAGMDPLSLGGRTIEARGLVEDRNGPAIAVSLPVRLRLLD